MLTWFVAAISRQSPHNWELCKKVGLFGLSTYGRKIGTSEIKVNDKVLVWLGKKGYIALATITDRPRAPMSREEAPWGGGLYRFGLVIPIFVDFEAEEPVWLGFKNGKQEETGLSQFALRKSFSVVPTDVALKAQRVLKDGGAIAKK